jgi:DNA-binding CsgD family transcriptional regulator
LAQLHFDDGDYVGARCLLEQGLAEAVGDPRLPARIQLDLAWVFSEAGAPQEALSLVQAVIDWAGRSGDRPLLGSALGADIFLSQDLGPVDEKKLERALALEDWTTRQFRGLRRTPGQLTVTEHRVAELAASGWTAKDIAASLFVSPRTVESNLARVYHKLGVSSRGELGARMTADRSNPRTRADAKTVNLRIDHQPTAADS